MTQRELADRIGVTQASLSAYEAGITYPGVDKIYDIARALHVETAELVR